jgi:hypothetical protein
MRLPHISHKKRPREVSQAGAARKTTLFEVTYRVQLEANALWNLRTWRNFAVPDSPPERQGCITDIRWLIVRSALGKWRLLPFFQRLGRFGSMLLKKSDTRQREFLFEFFRAVDAQSEAVLLPLRGV